MRPCHYCNDCSHHFARGYDPFSVGVHIQYGLGAVYFYAATFLAVPRDVANPIRSCIDRNPSGGSIFAFDGLSPRQRKKPNHFHRKQHSPLFFRWNETLYIAHRPP